MLFPVVLLLVFGVIQGGVWYYARQIALSAAQEGVRAGRVEDAAPGAPSAAARTFITEAGGELLLDPRVQDRSSRGEVRLTVHGRAPSVIPGVRLPLAQEAAGARERLTTPGGQP